MPRVAREKSSTGIYHIMMRGIDGVRIFHSDADKQRFIEIAKRAKGKFDFSLLGYCLMDNHVHLLIKESGELGVTIKHIAGSYAMWHNIKYDRKGYLFQGRYRSEVVETSGYLKAVIRYIHQNPVKANMTTSPSEYAWSSYGEYISSYGKKDTFVDVNLIKELFPNFEEFVDFMNMSNTDNCLDYEEVIKYTSDEIRIIIRDKLKTQESEIKMLPKKERDKLISRVYNITGASIRQLSNIMEIGKGIVEVAIKNNRS